MHHCLKTWPAYFEDVSRGVKTFELRKNDRDFGVGDVLILQEYIVGKGYTGAEVRKRITYILADYAGIESGYCILGLEDQPND